MRQALLIFVAGQITTECDSVVINCDRYYKTQNCYYILRLVRYYKMRQVLLQLTTGQVRSFL